MYGLLPAYQRSRSMHVTFWRCSQLAGHCSLNYEVNQLIFNITRAYVIGEGKAR
jgi:hypothetical protein